MRNIIIKSCLLIAVFLQFQDKLIAQATNKIDSVGNVGIGTTSPQVPLHIVGGAPMNGSWNKTSMLQATYPVQLFNSNAVKWGGVGYDYSTGMQFWVNGQSENISGTGKLILSLSNNGLIGMGTNEPVQNLHIKGVNPVLLIENARGQGGLNPSILRLYNNNIGYNSKAGEIQFTPIGGGTLILSSIAGGWSNAIEKGFLSFHTSDNYGATVTEKMRIDDKGNIGIGTNTPEYPLDIHYLGNAKYGLSISNHSDNLKLQLGTTTGSLLNIQGKVLNGQPYNIGLQAEGGNVGIGTSNPSSKLDVQYRQSSVYGLTVANITDNLKFKVGTTTNGYLNIQGATVSSNTAYNISLQSEGGNVGIGTTAPSEKLSVNGNVRAKKLIVSQTGWPDYVFDPAYKLKPLSELSAFIQEYKHLPEMPSAKEVEEKGISVGDNQALLLKKIEELTLYVIDLQKQIYQLKNKN